MRDEQETRSSEYHKIISMLTALKANTPEIPLIDPTANVIELFRAGEKRADDLRDVESQLREAEFKRIDDIRELERAYSAETSALREKLVEAESRRIDAVNLAESRRLDAGALEQKAAVQLASEKNAATAMTLAGSVAASAEALRAQVATTAAATTSQITQLREYVDKQIGPLSQSRFEVGGATAQRVESRGTSQWLIGLIVISFVSMLVSIISVAALFVKGH